MFKHCVVLFKHCSNTVRQPPADPHRSPPGAPPQTNLSIFCNSQDPILSGQPLKQVLARSHTTALAGRKQPKTAQNSLEHLLEQVLIRRLFEQLLEQVLKQRHSVFGEC